MATNTSGGAVYFGFGRNGSAAGWIKSEYLGCCAGQRHGCPPVMFWDFPAAGANTYSMMLYQATGNSLFSGSGDAQGIIMAMEFA